MDKKTAQKLIHRHLHNTQAVPWINESASQRAFPFGATLVQFALSEGTDRETINNQCYSLTALLGQVAAKLRHVDLTVQSELTIKAIVQIASDSLGLEHQVLRVTDTLVTGLMEQLSDWGEDGASVALAGLFGEALTVVAQTLNCVNNHEAWQDPKPSLLEACAQALEDPQYDWQVNVMRALADDNWGTELQDIARQILNPETRPQSWNAFNAVVQSCLKQKCCQCYETSSVRYSCGEYAGRYCDEHWETSGFRPASDRVDCLDAGEYETEEEAY